MASPLRNLLNRSQVTRIVSSLKSHHTPNLASPPSMLQPHLIDLNPNNRSSHLVPSPILELPKSENSTASRPSQFYPTYPFGFCLNPISSIGSTRYEPEDDAFGDSGTVWADSVKKKRKKKMNKHKFRKLRKRIRRQS